YLKGNGEYARCSMNSPSSLLSPLGISSKSMDQSRMRATYYQAPKRRIIPAFVRRFLLRYPTAPLWTVFGLCSSAMVFPVAHGLFKWATMSKEQFYTYCQERNALSEERQKFGTNLWFPFLGQKFDERPIEITAPSVVKSDL
ncbi:hypothetical protein PFISCL1PPCAC_10665, partial [Pristionchus fissidentatus]